MTLALSGLLKLYLLHILHITYSEGNNYWCDNSLMFVVHGFVLRLLCSVHHMFFCTCGQCYQIQRLTLDYSIVAIFCCRMNIACSTWWTCEYLLDSLQFPTIVTFASAYLYPYSILSLLKSPMNTTYIMCVCVRVEIYIFKTPEWALY